MKKYNQLKNETSPYLLQHAQNPVDWYPWGQEAFDKAKKEDKPIFLSIGYSTCHWCHVMAHESFENRETAEILNRHFVSIKVDKEERPDIDSIYMSICQAFTGSGGWPTSIFMTPEQKPFFAGTYFPLKPRYGMMGFNDLLLTIADKWQTNKAELVESSEEVIRHINAKSKGNTEFSEKMITNSISYFKKIFDEKHGGFGSAPKFPSPHNLLFLMSYYEMYKDEKTLEMVEKTLLHMYLGGIFDHIGFGFSRYSTDPYFLAPHFEKMLYDNALLLLAYTKAFDITQNPLYKEVAVKTADYILREMTHEKGGFFSAQDADSDGVEGKYYVFDFNELIKLLGADVGAKFNARYDITPEGNFEGKNIPNLLQSRCLTGEFDEHLPVIYNYRKARAHLHLDDKILTAWNALMISAFACMYSSFHDEKYLNAAERACQFIDENLTESSTLFVSFRDGKKSNKGFLDDYAFYIFALIRMYEATLDSKYVDHAMLLNQKAMENFFDEENGGFFLSGKENESLVMRPKDTYDGAIPSGNSVMCYNLLKLSALKKDTSLAAPLQKHLDFMASEAGSYAGGNSFYLLSVLLYTHPLQDVICVLADSRDLTWLKAQKRYGMNLRILDTPTEEYKLLNHKTTFYVCKNHSCLPPTNDLKEVFE